MTEELSRIARSSWINYHHLYYFKKIAELGGVSKASRALHIGQSALSMQMKVFESNLGFKLFQKEGRELKLTDVGVTVVQYANDIFRIGDDLAVALHSGTGQRQRSLKIGAVEDVPAHILTPFLCAAEKNVHSQINLQIDSLGNLTEKLRHHKVDIIITNSQIYPSTSLKIITRKIASMPIVIVGDKKYEKLKKGFPYSLAGHPFLMPPLHCSLRTILEAFFYSKKIDIQTSMEIQHTGVLKLLAMQGMGLLAMPLPAVEELIAAKRLTKIGILSKVHEDLWITGVQSSYQNPAAEYLLKNYSLDV